MNIIIFRVFEDELVEKGENEDELFGEIYILQTFAFVIIYFDTKNKL